MMRRNAIALLLVGVLGIAPKASAFSSIGSGFRLDTHKKMTQKIVADLCSQGYADICKYGDTIVAAVSNEGARGNPGAHTSPDGSLLWWYGNEGRWQTDLFQKYRGTSFAQSYTEIGYVVHLVQDYQSPAHQTITFHGAPYFYALAPGSDVSVVPPGLLSFPLHPFDNFEAAVAVAYAYGSIVDTNNHGTNFYSLFSDPNSLGCSFRFWLTHADAGAGATDFWGDYGGGNPLTCGDLPFNLRRDWFTLSISSSVRNLAETQLYNARVNSQAAIVAISTSLPPVITNFQTSNIYLGGGSTMTVTFRAVENRTQNITFAADVLDSNGNSTGRMAFSTQSITLDTGGNLLPYEKDVSVSWTGTPAVGAALSDGNYILDAYLYDGDGNQSPHTYANFKISTSTSPIEANPYRREGGQSNSGNINNFYCQVPSASNPDVGVCKLWLTPGSSTITFTAGPTNAFAVGEYCNLTPGSYTVTAESCSGVQSHRTMYVADALVGGVLTAGGTGWSGNDSEAVSLSTIRDYPSGIGISINVFASCSDYSVSAGGGPLSCTGGGGSALNFNGDFSPPPARSVGFSIDKLSSGTDVGAIIVDASINGHFFQVSSGGGISISQGAAASGDFAVTNITQVTFSRLVNASTLTVTSPFAAVDLSTRASLTTPEESARLRQVLRMSGGHVYRIFASSGDAVFTSTMTMDFALTDVAADTTTLRIYEFSGSRWESAPVTMTSASRTGSDVRVIGYSTHTGTYGVFFAGQDSSATITSFGIQGSSFVFDGTLFVSTDAYVVLTATDPTVSGYASGVATTVYRLDSSNFADSFSTYSSSIPLPLGTHVFEYFSYDWAGNSETVKTATFTVTAGAGFKNTSNHRVIGSLLAGFLGSGAQAEIVSGAENAYTLIASSADRSAMLAASNVGSIGVGPQIPEGRLDLGQGSVALALRSGNATSTGTAAQITFGYNGDYSMRHALRTRHSTATDGNRMDFMLWSPAAGATTTVANINALSLQGISSANDGSFHVMPYGEPDAEVEVSNGSSLGGGTMQRREVLTPSSRRFKSDIRYLDSRNEDAALEDVASLKHARFRYKSRDGRPQPQTVGLIYEEAPQSIQAAEKTLSTVERMAEVELALKAALRKIEALEKRHAELKRRRGSQ